jgi:outer membrane cobalamin receptor
MYLGLPSQGYGNQGIIGVIQRDIRGEKSGLLNSYLKTFFLQNEFKPNEKLDFTTRFVYRETGHGEDSYVYVTTDGTKLIRVLTASYSNRVLGEIIANYSLSEKHKFSAGVQYWQDNVEAGGRQSTIDLNTVYLLDGRDTVLNLRSSFLQRQYDIRNNAGSFLQYIAHTTLLGKTNFTLGVRYDYNSYFKDALSPRIAIVNQPAKKITFKAQFGIAFRAPTNLEIYQVPAGSNFVLKKERIRTYEVNAIYLPSEKLRLQLNGFRNELRDVIILGNLSGLTADKNPGKINITGAETIIDIVLAKNVSGFLNFTFQYAWGKNLLTGYSTKLPGVADVKGNFGITAHAEDLFTISFTGNWVGPRHSQRANPYGDVEGYFLGNFAVNTTKLFKNRITASLIVRNIFNAKWLDPGFRTADGLLYSTVLEQPGINGLFKIGVSL